MDRETRMRRIWETIQDIPRGNVANYGQVAEIAGIPRGARQVGYALRHSPKDLELPWHRVITSSGKSAFDPNSRAFRTQRDRLAEEGVQEVVEHVVGGDVRLRGRLAPRGAVRVSRGRTPFPLRHLRKSNASAKN